MQYYSNTISIIYIFKKFEYIDIRLLSKILNNSYSSHLQMTTIAIYTYVNVFLKITPPTAKVEYVTVSVEGVKKIIVIVSKSV